MGSLIFSQRAIQTTIVKSRGLTEFSTEMYDLIGDRLAQLVEHRTAVREVAGSNLDRTNTQGLKITEEKVLPL